MVAGRAFGGEGGVEDVDPSEGVRVREERAGIEGGERLGEVGGDELGVRVEERLELREARGRGRELLGGAHERSHVRHEGGICAGARKPRASGCWRGKTTTNEIRGNPSRGSARGAEGRSTIQTRETPLGLVAMSVATRKVARARV